LLGFEEGQAVHPQVRWVLSCQLLVTLVAALVAGVAQGVHAAISAALGGGIGVLSAYAYVWRALRGSGGSGASDSDPKKAFHAQVLGEGYKFAVTILLFTLVFKSYGQLAALPLFLAYAITIVVYWIALLKRR
jgi:ATP synthase protein I